MSHALPAWLPLLNKPYEEILGSRTRWDLRLPDGSHAQVERSGQGFNNVLFRVRHAGGDYACKLFLADERRRVEREWAALKAVQASGSDLAPEPLALAIDGPLPQPALVSTWTEGTSLAEMEMAPADLDALVAALARIHRTPPAPGLPFLPAYHQPAGYSAFLDEARGFLAQVQAWAAGLTPAEAAGLPGWAADLPSLLPLLAEALRQGEAAAAAAAGRATPGAPSAGSWPISALVRIDGNLSNVIGRPDGRPAFLDWEDSGSGDPAFDLAELRWHPRGLARISQRAWNLALAQYPAPDEDALFRTRLNVYSTLLPMWWTERSALHLLEGASQAHGRKRPVRLPDRLFRGARHQLDRYLAALGLIDEPDEDEREGD